MTKWKPSTRRKFRATLAARRAANPHAQKAKAVVDQTPTPSPVFSWTPGTPASGETPEFLIYRGEIYRKMSTSIKVIE